MSKEEVIEYERGLFDWYDELPLHECSICKTMCKSRWDNCLDCDGELLYQRRLKEQGSNE